MQNRILALIIFFAAAFAFILGYNAFPSPRHLVFSAPAISDTGKGNMVEFEMFFLKGEGRTLVNVQNAAFEQDVERALKKARANAEEYLGVRISKLDLVLEIRGSASTEVSGESAGGMFAVAIIALYAGKSLREDVAISASLAEDGTLHEVGGIEEKILAAAGNGRHVFLVSENQEIKEPEEYGRTIRIIKVRNLEEAAAFLIE